MPEEMPELKIRLELLHYLRRDEGRSNFATHRHLLQKATVPGISVCHATVELDRDTAKQVLGSCVERMQQRSQGGELDGARLLRATLLKKRTMQLQKVLQLSFLNFDLA